MDTYWTSVGGWRDAPPRLSHLHLLRICSKNMSVQFTILPVRWNVYYLFKINLFKIYTKQKGVAKVGYRKMTQGSQPSCFSELPVKTASACIPKNLVIYFHKIFVSVCVDRFILLGLIWRPSVLLKKYWLCFLIQMVALVMCWMLVNLLRFILKKLYVATDFCNPTEGNLLKTYLIRFFEVWSTIQKFHH